ncbi:MAG: hypothetical protein AB1481_00605 [Candidatus Omnitrophota bacterium]
MLEEDYLRDGSVYTGRRTEPSLLVENRPAFTDPRSKALNEYSTQLIKELIIPKLTREVNSAKRYAPLRQAYYSLILSRWFKNKFTDKKGLSTSKLSQGSLKGTVPSYVNRINSSDLTGLASQTPWSKTTYFNQYKKSFTDGEYNIKEKVYTPTGQVIRSYFSGGIAPLPSELAGVSAGSRVSRDKFDIFPGVAIGGNAGNPVLVIKTKPGSSSGSPINSQSEPAVISVDAAAGQLAQKLKTVGLDAEFIDMLLVDLNDANGEKDSYLVDIDSRIGGIPFEEAQVFYPTKEEGYKIIFRSVPERQFLIHLFVSDSDGEVIRVSSDSIDLKVLNSDKDTATQIIKALIEISAGSPVMKVNTKDVKNALLPAKFKDSEINKLLKLVNQNAKPKDTISTLKAFMKTLVGLKFIDSDIEGLSSKEMLTILSNTLARVDAIDRLGILSSLATAVNKAYTYFTTIRLLERISGYGDLERRAWLVADRAGHLGYDYDGPVAARLFRIAQTPAHTVEDLNGTLATLQSGLGEVESDEYSSSYDQYVRKITFTTSKWEIRLEKDDKYYDEDEHAQINYGGNGNFPIDAFLYNSAGTEKFWFDFLPDEGPGDIGINVKDLIGAFKQNIQAELAAGSPLVIDETKDGKTLPVSALAAALYEIIKARTNARHVPMIEIEEHAKFCLVPLVSEYLKHFGRSATEDEAVGFLRYILKQVPVKKTKSVRSNKALGSERALFAYQHAEEWVNKAIQSIPDRVKLRLEEVKQEQKKEQGLVDSFGPLLIDWLEALTEEVGNNEGFSNKGVITFIRGASDILTILSGHKARMSESKYGWKWTDINDQVIDAILIQEEHNVSGAYKEQRAALFAFLKKEMANYGFSDLQEIADILKESIENTSAAGSPVVSTRQVLEGLNSIGEFDANAKSEAWKHNGDIRFLRNELLDFAAKVRAAFRGAPDNLPSPDGVYESLNGIRQALAIKAIDNDAIASKAEAVRGAYTATNTAFSELKDGVKTIVDKKRDSASGSPVYEDSLVELGTLAKEIFKEPLSKKDSLRERFQELFKEAKTKDLGERMKILGYLETFLSGAMVSELRNESRSKEGNWEIDTNISALGKYFELLKDLLIFSHRIQDDIRSALSRVTNETLDNPAVIGPVKRVLKSARRQELEYFAEAYNKLTDEKVPEGQRPFVYKQRDLLNEALKGGQLDDFGSLKPGEFINITVNPEDGSERISVADVGYAEQKNILSLSRFRLNQHIDRKIYIIELEPREGGKKIIFNLIDSAEEHVLNVYAGGKLLRTNAIKVQEAIKFLRFVVDDKGKKVEIWVSKQWFDYLKDYEEELGIKDGGLNTLSGYTFMFKEASSGSPMTANDLTVEIDYIMHMLGIKDYPRAIQIFRMSIDPVAFVNELSGLSGKSTEEIISHLRSDKMFKALAALYRLRSSSHLDEREFQDKGVSIDVSNKEFLFGPAPLTSYLAGHPVSDYLRLMAESAKDVPFIFRDNMQSFVAGLLGLGFSGPRANPDLNGIIEKIVTEFLEVIELSNIKYLITSGIGANEMYSHQLAWAVNNYFKSKGKDFRWIVVNNPAHINIIPADATDKNTVIFEMSRSGSTKETLDFFNATKGRFKHRIVAANFGKLKELALSLAAQPDAKVLVIDNTPGDIGGRQMNRKTLMVYAPLFIALAAGTGNTAEAKEYLKIYTRSLLDANEELDYAKGTRSFAIALAESLFRHRISGRNKLSLVYDNSLRGMSKELIQLLNEGANKNIAGDSNNNILNSYSVQDDEPIYKKIFEKAGKLEQVIFLLDKNNPDYSSQAAYIKKLRGEGIPCITVALDLNAVDLLHNLQVLARTSALLQDMVVYFTYITNQDANSNPAVKFTREITAALFDILKEIKAKGGSDIRMTFKDVIGKISQNQAQEEKNAVKRIDDKHAETSSQERGEFSEFNSSLKSLARALSIPETDFILALLGSTSKSALKTDMGEAGGSKIQDITEAFRRSIINEHLGKATVDHQEIPLGEQVVLKDSSAIKVSLAVRKDEKFSSNSRDLAGKLSDYMLYMYRQRKDTLQYFALSCMESDGENPLLKSITQIITERVVDLGITALPLPLPGVAHKGIEAVNSHPESIFNIAVMYTNAYGKGLGTVPIEPGVTVDDATYIYGIGNVIRMALGGTPSIIFEVKNNESLAEIKDIVSQALDKFREKLASSPAISEGVGLAGSPEKTVTASDGTVFVIPDKFGGVKFDVSGHRGTRGEQVNPGVAAVIAQAICEFTGREEEFRGAKNFIVIGSDTRPDNYKYEEEEIRAALANGFGVLHFAGPMPTPIASFAIRFADRLFSLEKNEKVVGGINNTPSHNPMDDDGIKFNPGGRFQGAPSHPEVNEYVNKRGNEIIEKGEGVKRFNGDFRAHPDYRKVDPEKVVQLYIERTHRMIKVDLIRKAIEEKNLRWLFNIQHGVAGWWARKIFASIDENFLTMLDEEPLPDFGGKYPQGPNTENWGQLQRLLGLVVKERYPGGGATDGDGDRFFFTDENGRPINFNVVLELLYNYLRNVRGVKGTFKSNVDASSMFDKIGPVLVREKIGFKGFQGDLKDPSKDIVLAGEGGSGGLTIGPALDPEGIGHVLDKDGIIAQLIFVEMVADAMLKGKTVSGLIQELYETYGYYAIAKTGNIPIEGPNNLNIGKQVIARLQNLKQGDKFMGYEITGIDKTDGAKVFLKDEVTGDIYWILIRLSGTGGVKVVLRTYGETVSTESLDKANELLNKLCQQRDTQIKEMIQGLAASSAITAKGPNSDSASLPIDEDITAVGPISAGSPLGTRQLTRMLDLSGQLLLNPEEVSDVKNRESALEKVESLREEFELWFVAPGYYPDISPKIVEHAEALIKRMEEQTDNTGRERDSTAGACEILNVSLKRFIDILKQDEQEHAKKLIDNLIQEIRLEAGDDEHDPTHFRNTVRSSTDISFPTLNKLRWFLAEFIKKTKRIMEKTDDSLMDKPLARNMLGIIEGYLRDELAHVSAGSPVIDDLGAVDFRKLPMAIQPIGNFKGLDFSLPKLSSSALQKINIEQELKEFDKLVKAGITPSEERVNTVIAACVQKGEVDIYADSLLLCVVDMCKLQEQGAVESSPKLKVALAIIDSLT